MKLKIGSDYGHNFSAFDPGEKGWGLECEFTEAEVARILAAQKEWQEVEDLIAKRYDAAAEALPPSKDTPLRPNTVVVEITRADLLSDSLAGNR